MIFSGEWIRSNQNEIELNFVYDMIFFFKYCFFLKTSFETMTMMEGDAVHWLTECFYLLELISVFLHHREFVLTSSF